MYGWDRKIHPEDHLLTSQDLPSNDSDPKGQIFQSDPHTYIGFYFLHTINMAFLYLKKKGLQKLLNIT